MLIEFANVKLPKIVVYFVWSTLINLLGYCRLIIFFSFPFSSLGEGGGGGSDGNSII